MQSRSETIETVYAEALRILDELGFVVDEQFWTGDVYQGGLDSLGVVILLSELERRCGVAAVPPETLPPGPLTLTRLLGLDVSGQD